MKFHFTSLVVLLTCARVEIGFPCSRPCVDRVQWLRPPSLFLAPWELRLCCGWPWEA